MSLRTLQGLLVLTALAWAFAPVWGGYAFGAVYALVWLSVLLKRRAAGKRMRAHAEELGRSVTPEAVAWAQKNAFFYVWPESGEGVELDAQVELAAERFLRCCGLR